MKTKIVYEEIDYAPTAEIIAEIAEIAEIEELDVERNQALMALKEMLR